MAGGSMGPRGELPTITFLNQHNSKLHFKLLLLYSQISVTLISHQRNISLQHMKTIIAPHNWSNCREQLTVGCTNPIDTSSAQSLNPKFRKHSQKTVKKDFKSQRSRMSAT